MKRLSLILILAVLGITAACGSGSDEAAGTVANANHNEADIRFAQDMIPHHEQAVEMAEMALEKSDNSEIRDLATRIKKAQAPEIATMRGWLEDWDQAAESGGMGGMAGHGAGAKGAGAKGEGMMSDGDMKGLESASGAEFDVLFLKGMLEHHKGAVAMAKLELGEGQFADAKELAQAIVDTQEEEITEIEALLTAAPTTTAP